MRIVKDPKERRTEILLAAEELFRNQGYVNTTVDVIIQQVGVAKGTFYYYFKSKEDILDAIVHHMVDQICEEYKKVVNEPKMSAMDKMRLKQEVDLYNEYLKLGKLKGWLRPTPMYTPK